MMVEATILIPTHDHDETLSRSIASVLSQDIESLELFVVGDGASPATEQTVHDIAARDSRVRYFANCKGQRHGERHRHTALLEAQGEIVCYLSDDDLMLPNHVSYMRELLNRGSFAHCLPISVAPSGTIRAYTIDLKFAEYRRLIRMHHNRIPLSCAAHTLELYRRLPHGWRPAPNRIATDRYMWWQMLSVCGSSAISGFEPTVLHFPSPTRRHMTREQRLEELDLWLERTCRSDFASALSKEVIQARLDDAIQSQKPLIREAIRARSVQRVLS